MVSYREPCFCGALDCVRCYGPAAKFAGWCDDCIHAEEGECDPEKIAPGTDECLIQAAIDDRRIDDWEDRQLDRDFEAQQDRLDRMRDERMDR